MAFSHEVEPWHREAVISMVGGIEIKFGEKETCPASERKQSEIESAQRSRNEMASLVAAVESI